MVSSKQITSMVVFVITALSHGVVTASLIEGFVEQVTGSAALRGNGRRSSLLVKARIACAPLVYDFDECLQDVVETQNLGLANLWAKTIVTPSYQHSFLAQARAACAPVMGSGFEGCLRDVQSSQNLRVADLWSQTQARQERLRGNMATVAIW